MLGPSLACERKHAARKPVRVWAFILTALSALRGDLALAVPLPFEAQTAKPDGTRLELMDHQLIQALAKPQARQLQQLRYVSPALRLRFEHLDDKYTAIFRTAGLEIDSATTAEAASWLRSRPRFSELTLAMGDWARVRLLRHRMGGRQRWMCIMFAIRDADREPWRDALRSQWEQPPIKLDRALLRRLADDAQAMETQPR